MSNELTGLCRFRIGTLSRVSCRQFCLAFAFAIASLEAATCSAAFVVWEDQFTAPSAAWNVPAGTTFTYQPSSAANSEDGFEVVFTSTVPGAQYATYTLPFTELLAGDRIEWGVRTYWPYSAGATADRILLETAVFDSGFAIHDSGDTFTKLSQEVAGTLAASDSLWLGNNSAATNVDLNVPSVMYLDYIRITREVPEPAALTLFAMAAVIGLGACQRRMRSSK